MKRVLLLTGRPGVGKTTCLRRALEQLGRPAGGFFTEEIRERGRRVGFDLVTLDGQRAALARLGHGGGPRVGPYGVSVDAVQRVGVPVIREAVRRGRLVVIDEIGKMEMAVPAYREVVEEALQAPVDVLGVILSAPHPWADAIKAGPAVELIEVTPTNRDALSRDLAARLAAT
jgi:nucleoside-triphosphatase